MNQTLNLWGPALLVCLTVCLTVLIGIITNNKRIDDLRLDLTGQIGGLEKRIIDRIERLEHPVFRG